MEYNLLVVEDDSLVAAMIRESLSGTQFKVRNVAFTLESAEKYLASENFDAALLDINLSGRYDGIEIGRRIRDHYKFPFIYLTAHADDRTLQNAKLTEPAGYIVKPFYDRELIAGLEIALYNYKQASKPASNKKDYSRLDKYLVEPLSKREQEVIDQLFLGKTNIEMSQALFISVNTVKSHLRRMFSKFSVASRTELVARVLEYLEK